MFLDILGPGIHRKRRRIIRTLFVFTIFFPGTVFMGVRSAAGGDIHHELGGYVKHMFAVSEDVEVLETLGLLSGDYLLANYSRFRLKGKLRYRDLLRFSLDYEMLSTFGDTQKAYWNAKKTFRPVQPDLFKDVAPLIPGADPENVIWDLESTISEEESRRIAHRIDRLSMAAYLPHVDLIVGRQALSWGSGMIWRPTDLFNPFSPTELDIEEKRGTDAVSAELHLGMLSSFHLIWAPDLGSDELTIDMEESRIGGRMRSHYAGLDFAVMGGYFRGKWGTGGDFAFPMAGAVVRGECLVTMDGDDNDDGNTLFHGVLNVDYAFPHNLYTFLEYYYNGLGTTDTGEYGTLIIDPDSEWRRRLGQGEVSNFGRHELASMLSWEAHPLVLLTTGWIVNLVDGSFLFYPQVEWSVREDLVFIAGANVTLGPDNSEYGGFRVVLLAPIFSTYLDPPNYYFIYGKFYF